MVENLNEGGYGTRAVCGKRVEALNGAQGAPRIISWNITLRCPLKCSHCSVDAGDKEAGLRCGVRVTFTKGNQHELADLPPGALRVPGPGP